MVTGQVVHPRVEKCLEKASVSYRLHVYADLPIPIRSPSDFATVMGVPLARITKTLFLRGDVAGFYALATCSVDRRPNLKRLAEGLQRKSVELAAPDEVDRMLGYPPHAVSPIGTGFIPVILDNGLFGYETVFVGGGMAGVEIEISPRELLRVSRARLFGFADLVPPVSR